MDTVDAAHQVMGTITGSRRIYEPRENEPVKLEKSNIILLGPTGSGRSSVNLVYILYYICASSLILEIQIMFKL